ncbi:SH3 domain-containing protein [Halobacillus sp. A5]|uniref:SH3 domain-containing protein n=1 Tax=Halobacillus sp. A5 TaxID=2880263 RepID=UPI0020A621C7|nr:SH3 domain-containing protein [Halobacillus sp. A5]MCP3028075.1 SH3 domain-containing protein [Halobacillus sp. A5]
MQSSFSKLLLALFLIPLFVYVPELGDSVQAEEQIKGIALKDDTTVFSDTNRNSNSLKQYDQGHILRYREYNSNWYIATVYLNYKAHTGYIHKDDVESAVSSQQSLEGRANTNVVNVYKNGSTNSKALKSYGEGHILKYKTFSENWYEATVYLNYEPHTGYIHKSHVETSVQDQEDLTGIALNESTHVYSKASKNSKALKSYSNGTILQYKSYLGDWYEATVYLNNEAHTGYIHKNDVETGQTNGQKGSGVTLLEPTQVYSDASTSSNVLKSYSPGSDINYKRYSNNWHTVEVTVNGEKENGYVHKNHVEQPAKSNNDYRGIGLQSPTHVYEAASTSSNPLKSYDQGKVLQYRDFSSNWYEATVYLNNKAHTGYIHKSHVENLSGSQEPVRGLAAVNNTTMHQYASKSSSKLETFDRNDILNLKTFSNNWYEAEAYINGSSRTGYIHKDQVSVEDLVYETTSYDHHFEDVLDTQMTRTPKADGAGLVAASEEQVEYYLNPKNVDENSTSFYQFLKLSQPAGLSASEINEKILYNSEILKGEASSFVQAGQTHDINEAYLISHAIHETGHGSSKLAQGIPVDNDGNVVDESEKTHTVYNIYGIGAYDDSPISGGAKRAFNEGWFSPEEAIIGGAQFVSVNYVHRGQDTLYKMRWNPDNPGDHQYATHVAWADIQTRTIANIYDALDNYVLVFDVPSYDGQPSSIPEPDPEDPEGTYIDYPDKVKGEVVVESGSNLNLRKGPSTDDSILKSIPNGSQIEVIGTNGSWYEIKYDGTTGWVSGEFVKLLNLLEVTVSDLNVRTGSSINNQSIGKLQNNEYVAGVLNKDNELVTDNEWYMIYYDGREAWSSSGTNNNYIIEK